MSIVRQAWVFCAIVLLPAAATAQCVFLEGQKIGKGDVGVAWCIDAERRLFATDYQLVAGQSKVKLGGTLEVSEFVAADRGKSLVLLQLSAAKAPGLRSMPLATAMPEIDGPLQMNIAGAILKGKLTALESGEEYLLGLKERRSNHPGRDADAIWLRTDMVSGLKQRGAPVGNEAGEVIGIVVACDAEDDYLTRAIHVNHLRNLLRYADAPARPLSELSRYVMESAPARPAGWIDHTLSTSLAARGQPPAERLEDFAKRWAMEKLIVDQQQAELKVVSADVFKLAGQINKIERQQKSIQKEIAAIEATRPRMAVPVYGGGKGEKGDKDYKPPQLKGFNGGRTIVGALAPEQQLQVNQLSLSLVALEKDRQPLAVEYQRKETMQTLLSGSTKIRQQRLRLMPRQLIALADCLGFDSAAQHQVVADWFTEQLKGEPENSVYLLGRALAKMHLGQGDEALRDLLQAEKQNDELPKPVIMAARARVLLRMDRTADGKAQLTAALAAGKAEPFVNYFAGLAACDAGHYAKSVEYFEAALACGGDEAEIKTALALVQATAPVDAARDAKGSLACAWRAREMTGGTDWHALLALAAAQAENGAFDEAASLADQAQKLAPAENAPLCQRWHELFASRQPARDFWKK